MPTRIILLPLEEWNRVINKIRDMDRSPSGDNIASEVSRSLNRTLDETLWGCVADDNFWPIVLAMRALGIPTNAP